MSKTQTKTTTVRARIEPDIKRRAEKVLKTIGLTSSEAINVFYHKIAAEQGIPFSLHIPNRESQAAIEEVRATKKVKNLSLEDWKLSLKKK